MAHTIAFALTEVTEDTSLDQHWLESSTNQVTSRMADDEGGDTAQATASWLFLPTMAHLKHIMHLASARLYVAEVCGVCLFGTPTGYCCISYISLPYSFIMVH